MGMFDTLTCERALPDGCDEREFQTKSLGSALRRFRLSAGGRLLRDDGADTGFHGVMRFYTRARDGHWHAYEAKFTDGQLQRLAIEAQALYDDDGLRTASEAPPPTDSNNDRP